MSAHFTRVSLALLTAVFLLGCQDLGSGPVGVDGLEPQFAKKCESPPCGGGGGGGGGDDNGGTKGKYLIEFFGDMTGDGVSPEERITSNSIHVGRFGEVTIENGILFDHNLPQRNTEFQSCFGGKGFMAGDPDAPVTLGFEDASGEDTLGDVGLGINHVKKKPVTQAGVVIHFRAKGINGSTDIGYSLEMGFGDIADLTSDWIPTEIDESNSLVNFPQWTLTAANVDQDVACSGTGDFVENLEAKVTRKS